MKRIGSRWIKSC